MALRHRQMGGIPLPHGPSIVLTIVGMFTVWFLSVQVWSPLLGIPEEFRSPIASIGCVLYLFSCAKRVPVGKERAQLFFGMYTGISFPAGICLLPRLPFPVVSLVLQSLLSTDISSYLGWTLEGDVHLDSSTVEVEAEGVTSDGARVTASITLILEVENAATYLTQTSGSNGKKGLYSAIASQCSTRIKQRVIAKHKAVDLMRAEYNTEYDTLNEWITEACAFVNEFGLSLAQSPIVKIHILSDHVRKVFDSVSAKGLFDENTKEVARQFKVFMENLPQGVSEEVALILFNQSRGEQGLPSVDMNILKLK